MTNGWECSINLSKRRARCRLCSTGLTEGINIVFARGQKADAEAELLLIQAILGIKLGTTGVGSDAGLAVVNIDDCFAAWHELVVVSIRVGQVVRREVRAVEAEARVI